MSQKFPQPYRGQPRPKYPKPKRQIRNLQRERNIDSIQNSVFFLLAIISIALGIIYSSKNSVSIFLGIVAFIFFSILSKATSDGAENINKFRGDYDIDVSSREEFQEEENQ